MSSSNKSTRISQPLVQHPVCSGTPGLGLLAFPGLNLVIFLAMTTVNRHFSPYQWAILLETKMKQFCGVHTILICWKQK
jgi:hypothetical protein